MRFREDYAEAGVPMLPVVAATERVVRRIVTYSLGDGGLLAAAAAGRVW